MTSQTVRVGDVMPYAAVAGVVLGVAYTCSPTTVVFLLAMPLLFLWAQRGLGPRERRWVLGILGVALASRLVILWAFFLAADHFKTGIDGGRVVAEPYGALIGDERFLLDRPLWMMQLGVGHRLEARDFHDLFGAYGSMGVMQHVMAYWQLWVGSVPYGARVIGVAAWLVGAVALHRTARRAYGPLPALGGFVIVLFMPTLFVWSISALKEPPIFLLTALILAGTMACVRGVRLPGRVLAALLVVACVSAIATLRSIGLFVSVGGIAFAFAGWLATRRARLAMAVGLLLATGAFWVWRRPAVEARVMSEYRQAAVTHVGNVHTSGYSYRLLDPYFYTRDDDSLSYMQPIEAARFTLRAAASFFTVPLPWQAVSTSALLLLPQQVVWYVLGVLAWVGIVAGLRRDELFTWLLVGQIMLGGAAVVLYNGNVGTFVRLRDSIVPIVAWLSAVGGCAALDRIGRRFSRKT